MVVRSVTAFGAAQDLERSGPVRTCIGCRKRAAAAELLRVVAATDPVSAVVLAVPDPRGRAAGRGAWLHPDPQCVLTAQRRKAFGRALRVTGEIDPTPIGRYVASTSADVDSPH